ncbi:MAG: TIGR01777 family oxidoreductase [Desulfopila sp.]|nr:TIGR01777 family oxidoreductase [Desulfopila sp.]
MKIFMTGGTGFVGTNLSRRLLQLGHEVTVVGSSGKAHLEKTSTLHILKADTAVPGKWQENLASFDVIINLTGRTIFNYWTESYKEKMYASRVETTRNIVNALPDSAGTVLLSASAAGYYGDKGETAVDESGEAGSDFLADVCKSWEREAMHAVKKGVRVATMRFGVVLGKGGGAIETMKTPFKLGLGGAIGDGRQWFPWIHVDDLVAAVLFLMDGSGLEGPFNFTAPESVRQQEFAKKLASFLHRPAIIPAPSFLVKTVAGEFGRSLLQGQKVVPKALLDHGFVFRYPTLDEALREILND